MRCVGGDVAFVGARSPSRLTPPILTHQPHLPPTPPPQPQGDAPLTPPTLPTHQPHQPHNHITQVMVDPAHLEGLLAQGAASADAIAEQSLGWAKDAMGFYSLPPLKQP